MDLGQFHPLADFHSAGKDSENRSVAGWRLAPKESFSDWTIEIEVEDPETDSHSSSSTSSHDVYPIDVYHVHKTNLGCGSRSSQYFAKLFQTHFAESSNHKSTIVLPKPAATHFPLMLDFVYEGTLENVKSASSAAAMRYLANYFCIEDLFCQVNTTFISRNLTNETCLSYLKESLVYQDDSLGKAAIECFTEAIFDGITKWKESMAQLPLSVVIQMARYRYRVKPNHSLRFRFACFVMNYVYSDLTRQTKEDVLILTKALSCLAKRSPFGMLDIAEYYALPMDHPLRCIPTKRMAATWKRRHYLQGKAGDDAKSAKYASFSDAQKVKILELSLQQASTDLDSFKKEYVSD